MIRKFGIAFSLLAVAPVVHAIQREGVELNLSINAYKCLKQVNSQGMLRKYHVKYQYPMSIKTSSYEENFSKASAASSSESSTRQIDPGITTGKAQSTAEILSSEGICSKYLSENRPLLRRHTYVVENFPELRSDVARGGGEYLDTFQHLSQCHGVSSATFSQALKSHYDILYHSDDPIEFAYRVDGLIRSDSELKAGCNATSA